MSKCVLLSALLLQAMIASTQTPAAPGKPTISFEKWLSVRQTGTVVLSPDGANIAYTVNLIQHGELDHRVPISDASER